MVSSQVQKDAQTVSFLAQETAEVHFIHDMNPSVAVFMVVLCIL